MSFLTPIWLFATAAISIPVIIHLWNIRPGKTLKVGSIALIEASSRKRSRSLKLLDLLLLFLRCLMLILIAFVLALPYFKQQSINKKSKGWLLIPKENFKEAYQHFKPKADSLIRAGYELHYFNSDFQSVTTKQALIDTSRTLNNNFTSYWNLLQQLDGQVPAALPVYLITPALLNKFTGYRPKVGLKLSWQTYVPADSAYTWIKSAWFTANKDIHVVQGISKPSGTVYNVQTITSGAQQNSPYNISVNNGKSVISLKNNDQERVDIDTASLNIEVFADNNTIDAGYINAALASVSQFTQRKILVKPFSNNSTKKDWLFWLSDKPVNKSVTDRFSNVLAYESGKAIPVNSWISGSEVHSAPQGQQLIPLYKLVNEKAGDAEILWHDGFGNQILSSETKDGKAFYHFYSHFNPAWNDLVWNAGFPKMMLQLILNNTVHDYDIQHDKRIIDSKQIEPELIHEVSVLQNSFTIDKDLTRYFWFAVVLIFFIERWLAYKKSTNEAGRIK